MSLMKEFMVKKTLIINRSMMKKTLREKGQSETEVIESKK